MTTKITADNIAANTITSEQLSPGIVASLFTAGDNITIEANGRISATISASGNSAGNLTIETSIASPVGLHMKDAQKNVYRLYTYDTSLTATDAGTIGGIDFNDDGTRMFLLNQNNDKILEFYISDGWNVANARYTGNIVTLSGAGNPNDLIFKPDGTKLYIVSVTGPVGVVEYSLSTPWNISTITLSNTFVSSSQEGSPYSIHIGDNGSKLYLVGQTNDTVYEYNLSVPWNLANISYSGNSYSIAAEEGTPYNIFLSDDGRSMYTHGVQNDFLKLHTLSIPWNISTASFTKDLISFKGWPTSPFTVKAANNGSRIYVIDVTEDTIFGFTTRKANGDLGVSCKVFSEAASPFGLYIKPDGNVLYVADSTTDRVFQYNLTIPYDISTAVLTSNVSFAANSTLNDGFTMSNDGNYFFVSSSSIASRWRLSVPWDITTASWSSVKNVSGTGGNFYNIAFDANGTRSCGVIYSLVYESDTLTQFKHPPYDIANATIEYAFSLSDLFGYAKPVSGIRFNSDGTKVYLLISAEAQAGAIEEYSLSNPYDLYSADWNNSKVLRIGRWYGDSDSGITVKAFDVVNSNLYYVSNETDVLQQIQLS